MTSTRQLRSTKRRTQQPSDTVIAPALHLTNTKGLACLADELYLEILSHLPAFPIPTEHSEKDIELYGHRRLALDALSKTCRSLRRVFLPYLWQRIEVYDTMDLGEGRLPGIVHKTRRVFSSSKAYAAELLRQFEIVTIRNPILAESISVLDILITNYSAKSMLPEIAHCVTLLPNVHTVQIQFDVGEQKLIMETFAPYVYPQIQTVGLSTYAHSFLRSCPNVKAVFFGNTAFRYWDYRELLLDICSKCPLVESISLSCLTSSTLFGYSEQLLKIQTLRELIFKSFRKLPHEADMKVLWRSSSLQTVRITFEVSASEAHDVEEWKLRMEQILGDRKRLIVDIL